MTVLDTNAREGYLIKWSSNNKLADTQYIEFVIYFTESPMGKINTFRIDQVCEDGSVKDVTTKLLGVK